MCVLVCVYTQLWSKLEVGGGGSVITQKNAQISSRPLELRTSFLDKFHLEHSEWLKAKHKRQANITDIHTTHTHTHTLAYISSESRQCRDIKSLQEHESKR